MVLESGKVFTKSKSQDEDVVYMYIVTNLTVDISYQFGKLTWLLYILVNYYCFLIKKSCL